MSDDLFPAYLQPEQAHREIGESESLRAVQECKNKAVEHVRYRVVDISAIDPYAAANVVEIRKMLHRMLTRHSWDRVRQVSHLADLHEEKAPGSARAGTLSAHQFLDAASQE